MRWVCSAMSRFIGLTMECYTCGKETVRILLERRYTSPLDGKWIMTERMDASNPMPPYERKGVIHTEKQILLCSCCGAEQIKMKLS